MALAVQKQDIPRTNAVETQCSLNIIIISSMNAALSSTIKSRGDGHGIQPFIITGVSHNGLAFRLQSFTLIRNGR